MISKTFKSAKSPLELGVVRANPDHVRVWIGEADKRMFGMIDLAPSDAPALAMAILEAVGVEAFGAGYLNKAVDCLQQHTREQERATAEARERAELEAEALELFKASGAYGSDRLFLKFSDLEETTQSAWLAVARRARELAKEATK